MITHEQSLVLTQGMMTPSSTFDRVYHLNTRVVKLISHVLLIKRHYILTLLLLAFSLQFTLQAQRNNAKNRFGAGIIAGINTSQINGDRLTGYHKFGVFAGIRAMARLTNTSELAIEMQYIRKGSRDPNQFVPGQTRSRFISLDYVEVPILFHKIIQSKTARYGLEGGLAYARLLGFKINENPGTINYRTFTEIQNDFNNEDLVLLVGGGIMIGKHYRIMTRFGYSLIQLFENQNPVIESPDTLPEFLTLRSIQLSFGLNYLF